MEAVRFAGTTGIWGRGWLCSVVAVGDGRPSCCEGDGALTGGV